MADKKGQQYLEIVAEYEPLPLDLIHFCAFKNVSLSSSGCCVKDLYSSCDVGMSLCVHAKKNLGVSKETFRVV